MSNALPAVSAEVIAKCRGCGLICLASEVIDGYCDEQTECHRLGVAAERERLECEEEMAEGFVCTCGEHKEVA